MKYEHELRSLIEIHEVCNQDLRNLLRCDYPPHNYEQLIARERKNISDIDHLIADVRAKIVAKNIHRRQMKEYTKVQGTNRFKI